MKKFSLVIAILAIAVLVMACLVSCVNIPDEPADAAKKLEDAGCIVITQTSAAEMAAYKAAFEAKNIFIVGDIRAYLTITYNGETGKLIYLETSSDADEVYEGYSRMESYSTLYRDNLIIYAGADSIYEILKQK